MNCIQRDGSKLPNELANYCEDETVQYFIPDLLKVFIYTFILYSFYIYYKYT